MKLFLDTNVLIDYYSHREPFFQNSKLLWIASFFGDVELWASIQSFVDIEFILQREIPIRTLRNMMTLSLEDLKIASPRPKDLAAGLTSGWPDLEDFLIARCAFNEGADYLITRDANGFKDSEIPALSPAGFFHMLESDFGIVYDEEVL